MPKKSRAAEAQFAALGISESEYTDAMRLAVKQKWSSLPIDKPVAELRAELAALVPPEVPTADDLVAAEAATYRENGNELKGDELTEVQDAAAEEVRRLKRNASVAHWRARNQLQAALDARQLKFAALRAKRGGSGGGHTAARSA